MADHISVAAANDLLGSFIIARDNLNAAIIVLTQPDRDREPFHTIAREAQAHYQDLQLRVLSAMTGVPVG